MKTIGNNIKNNDIIIGCMCAIGSETIYGLSYIFTKQVTESVSTFALLGWRFFIALTVMSILAAAGIIKIKLKGKSLKPLISVALCSPCIYFIAETIGISRTTASESGVVLACIPVVSMLASAFILKKKPAPMEVAGITIALAGVVITVFAVGTSSSLSIVGYAFLFIAVLSYALYSIFVDKASDYSEAEITYIMLIAGAALFILLALLEAAVGGGLKELLTLPFRDSGFLTAILYQGICCSIAAFFMANTAIAKIGVNRTSSFIGVEAVVSVILGSLILKETLTKWQIIGSVIIIIGVYAANAKKKDTSPAE